MKIDESLTSTATIVQENKLKHSINHNQLHNQHSNDTISLCSSQTSSSVATTTTTTTKPVKILKAFYKKDASASVNKSFDNYNNLVHIFNNNNIQSIKKENEQSRNRISEDQNDLKRNATFDANISNDYHSSSCLRFTNQLIDNSKFLQPNEEETLPSSNYNTIKSNTKSTQSKLFSTLNLTKTLRLNSINNNNNNIETTTNEMSKTDLSLLSKKFRKQIPFYSGLKNHGNTCFMNCILQCLFHTSPICQYFLSSQYEMDIKTNHNQQAFRKQQSQQQQQQPNQSYLLSRYFYRLLVATWRNVYESSYSAEMKNVIGYLNSVFAGVNQHDSHELCVWFLDRLSQDLTTSKHDSLSNQTVNSSFIQDLVQVKFKSTLNCTKCNYESSKYESDMMLSLPLPQFKKRRSFYAHLILNNSESIRSFLSDSVNDLDSKSKFYVNPDADSGTFQTPFHVSIGINVLVDANCESMSTQDGTIINPSVEDLRRYIQQAHDLQHIVFYDLNDSKCHLGDRVSVKEQFGLMTNPNSVESMCIVELSKLPVAQSQNTPFINLIAMNVYYDADKLLSYGLPFSLLINRDCSYKDLCKKLLESQSKYFKDKNVLKYKELADKLFNVSLYDPLVNQMSRLNVNDELPLYAEFIDRALNESMSASNKTSVEHLRLNIEWKCLDDVQKLVKETEFYRTDYFHKSVKYLKKLDETDQTSAITLHDCFELFTQSEELTDENSWMCPNCKKQSNAHKKLAIASAPSILIIHLKRFFYKSNTANSKLTTPVWFPTCSLDISNYLIKNENGYGQETRRETNNNNNIYDLFAVCNHQGQNMANGHYTAFCKNMVDTRWYCFDDSNCIQLVDGQAAQSTYSDIFNNGSGQVCSENAYILFYKRRDCMRNEMWWTEYVDRSLFDYTEFVNYVNNWSLIEREQRVHQEKQQNQQFLNFYNLNNPKYNSSSKLSSVNLSRKVPYESDFVLMCPRDSAKSVVAERLPRVDLTNESYSRESLYINHYDELNKPKRLLKKSLSKELNGSSAVAGGVGSASNSSTSSSSPSKQSPSINNLTASKSNSNYSIQHLSEDFDKQINIPANHTTTDKLLSYPNDNEYIYTNPKSVNNMQYVNVIPTVPRTTVLNAPTLLSNHMLQHQQLQQPHNQQGVFYYNQTNANTNYNPQSSTDQYFARHHPVLYEKTGSQFSSSNISTESSSRPQSTSSLNANSMNAPMVNSPLTVFNSNSPMSKTPTPTKPPSNRYPTGIETTI